MRIFCFVRGRHRRWILSRGHDAVADDENLIVSGMRRCPIKRCAKIRCTQWLARTQCIGNRGTKTCRAAVKHRLRGLIERGDIEGEVVAVARAQASNDVGELAHFAIESECARRTGIDEDRQAMQRLGRGFARHGHPRCQHAIAHHGIHRRRRHHAEIAIRGPMFFLQRRELPMCRAEIGRRDHHLGVDFIDLG